MDSAILVFEILPLWIRHTLYSILYTNYQLVGSTHHPLYLIPSFLKKTLSFLSPSPFLPGLSLPGFEVGAGDMRAHSWQARYAAGSRSSEGPPSSPGKGWARK